ncbi:thioesterase II family protein [Streptomyces albidoflavus]|uniref:thioesterase II family protein n=1 Tax=Streptomyces albidoflavus TaxID=1886 RepID=UPI000FEDC5CE|nr:alpha/beta fold hydrolase [Streptomyces albidoflavus]RWZ76522.1 thioesterase [Streptomyces albidoflavus]
MARPLPSRNTWFRTFHARPDARVTLVCLPYAGGSASAFISLSERLPPWIEVFAAQYPGRQDRIREPCLTTVPELAEAAFEELRALAANRPCALLGHSMGAAVAFELTRLLERDGPAAPQALFVSGRRAPSISGDRGVRFRDDEGIVDELRELEGTDSRVFDEPELLGLILPTVRADYGAAEAYSTGPDAMVGSPVVALVGDRDHHVPMGEAAAWSEHTTGAFELEVFPGGHFFLTDNEPAIASLVTDTLRAPTSSGPSRSDAGGGPTVGRRFPN